MCTIGAGAGAGNSCSAPQGEWVRLEQMSAGDIVAALVLQYYQNRELIKSGRPIATRQLRSSGGVEAAASKRLLRRAWGESESEARVCLCV